MADEKYNGWTNYETWATNLWMTRDEVEYTICCAVCREAESEFAAADQLKLYYERQLDELQLEPSMFSNILNASFKKINWYEIAVSLHKGSD